MMSVTEVKRWLATMPDDGFVAIDDGGLALVEVDADGETLDAYLEVGGAADPRNKPRGEQSHPFPRCDRRRSRHRSMAA